MFAVVNFTTMYERYVTVLIFELFRIFSNWDGVHISFRNPF